jgi:cold shock CspA family protein
MTGTIRALDRENGSGVILSETGTKVPFDAASVLAYDAKYLAVGQRVTFESGMGTAARAVNVCVFRPTGGVEPKAATPDCLRYMGFQQGETGRMYRFENVFPADRQGSFLVAADLSLFAKHRIALQEGPAICLRLLTDELRDPGCRPATFKLTERHLLDFLARRPPPRTSPGPKRIKRPSPAPVT